MVLTFPLVHRVMFIVRINVNEAKAMGVFSPGGGRHDEYDGDSQ